LDVIQLCQSCINVETVYCIVCLVQILNMLAQWRGAVFYNLPSYIYLVAR